MQETPTGRNNIYITNNSLLASSLIKQMEQINALQQQIINSVKNVWKILFSFIKNVPLILSYPPE